MRTLQSLLWSERSGTTAIEYALIVLLIGLVIISLQNSIGASVRNFFLGRANGL
jgi:Flp pilus assembly pilin Flp